MSNISIYKPEPIPETVTDKLSRSENSVAVVSLPTDSNPRISEMAGQQIAGIISKITIKAAIRLGSKARDREEQQILNMELNSDLMKFPMLTEREIMKALENGLDGLYKTRPDELVLFTPSNFVQWVRAYIEQTKKPVMKKVAQLIQQERDQEWIVPDSEKLKMSFEFFKTIFKRVLDGEHYQDYGNVLYAFLEKIGFLILDSADKWKAIDMAKLQLVVEARENKDAVIQRNAIQNAMELIQKAETEKPDDAIITIAKRILISQKLQAYKAMPEEEQTELLEAISDRVDYLCIELKDPEQFSEEPEQ